MVGPQTLAKIDAAVAKRIASSIRDEPAYVFDRFPQLKKCNRKALRRLLNQVRILTLVRSCVNRPCP